RKSSRLPLTGTSGEQSMTEKSQAAEERAGGAGASHRSVEIGVALFIAVFALVVVGGSVQAGIGWGAEGPKAGFFPFYVGLTILGGSFVNLGGAVSERPDGERFAEWGRLGQVMAMLVPTA